MTEFSLTEVCRDLIVQACPEIRHSQATNVASVNGVPDFVRLKDLERDWP